MAHFKKYRQSNRTLVGQLVDSSTKILAWLHIILKTLSLCSFEAPICWVKQSYLLPLPIFSENGSNAQIQGKADHIFG